MQQFRETVYVNNVDFIVFQQALFIIRIQPAAVTKERLQSDG